eukprot:NODE_393_length_8140_cov_0.738341.p3 type:complete len:342 gc:universal NODE_393_length_8140_cov_0.738341:2050-3075(+)
MHLLPQNIHPEADIYSLELFQQVYHEIQSVKSLVISSKYYHKLSNLPKLKHISVINRSNHQMIQETTTTSINIALEIGDDLSELTDEMKLLFKTLTIKSGKYFDAPKSTQDIPKFIKTYHINMNEYENKDYTSFNDFFTRQIKLEYRLLNSNKMAFTSAADSRCMVFNHPHQATDIWIKGNQFSISNLTNPEIANQFKHPQIIIFRLAPDDYHRWHYPFNGHLTYIQSIPGTYYTVNPKAIHSPINVFTDNHRIIRCFNTPFGPICEIAIGALLVGSIQISDSMIHNEINKGDEAGYFKYGGSTVIYLMQGIEFDDDLVHHSLDLKMETLVRAREQVGLFK